MTNVKLTNISEGFADVTDRTTGRHLGGVRKVGFPVRRFENVNDPFSLGTQVVHVVELPKWEARPVGDELIVSTVGTWPLFDTRAEAAESLNR